MPPPTLDFRNVNALWGSVLVETLVRCGVRHLVASPGSRSTPLTLQAARHPGLEALAVLDERSAAFLALGLARRSGRAVALVCTSGTAAANYLPAVVEARMSGVPLLVLTADRPPEMRACRSGQTIDQVKLFGAHVIHFHEAAVPAADLGLLRYLRQTVAHAVARCGGPVAGPVHLNLPFRDPLPPLEDGSAEALRNRVTAAFFRHLGPPRDAVPVPGPMRLGGRGLIVAGQARPADPAAYARAVGRLARRLGWPVLADVLSPLRHHARSVPGLVTRYDLIARSSELARELRPEHVVVLHDWPTSKALRQWLGAVDAPTTLVIRQDENPDALHGAARVVPADVASFASAVRGRRAPAAWLRRWSELERRADRALRRGLAGAHPAFEGRVAATLPSLLPRGSTVMVAASMPVRDAEYFWPANDRTLAVHSNRGANGIDGTLSTAVGLALGGSPVVLLTGDLSFLHDSNGLLLARTLRGRSLTVVVINNNGGGIFEHLPIARFDPPFERFFATPQEVDLGRLCAAHAVPHAVVRGLDDLARRLARAARGLRVLEWRSDRKADAAFRQRLFAQVAAQLA